MNADDKSTQVEAPKLGAEERQRLRRAHEGLRAASKELESLVATEPIKNRWEPEAAPPEILDAARVALQEAWDRVVACQQEVLGWDAAPPGSA
jgi:hypothetical protein